MSTKGHTYMLTLCIIMLCMNLWNKSKITLYSHYAIYCKSLPSLLGASFIHFYNTPSKTFRWHHGMKQGGKRTISREDNGRLPPEESRICFQSLLFCRLRYVVHFHLKATHLLHNCYELPSHCGCIGLSVHPETILRGHICLLHTTDVKSSSVVAASR